MDTNTYIAEVKNEVRKVNESFNDFVNLLERLEKEPWLVLTDFSSKLENPIFSIAQWGPNTFQESLLPFVQTISEFVPFFLQSSQYGKTIDVLDAELDRCVLTINLQDNTFKSYIEQIYEPELDERIQRHIKATKNLLEKINKYGNFYKFHLDGYERLVDNQVNFSNGLPFSLKTRKQRIEGEISNSQGKLKQDYEHDMRAYLKNKDLKEKNEDRVNELMSYLISLNFTQKQR